MNEIQNFSRQLLDNVEQVIIGKRDILELLMVSILCEGHVLLEDVPGTGKTMLARALAAGLNVDFKRLQCTPDLLPNDVTGVSIYDPKQQMFTFIPGPVFTNILLADEINRATPRTQSALLEAMEERQVTVDGITYNMARPFMVLATQNPIEQEGTYKLPEAQLDRFLFKVILSYPSLEEEQSILRRFRDDFSGVLNESVTPVLSPSDIAECQRIIEQVYIREELLDYIAAIVHSTRNNADLFLGASPRASLSLMKSAKAVAAMSGRNFVTPDDIRYVSYPVLNHRVILTPEREMEGYTTREVLDEIVKKIEVPR